MKHLCILFFGLLGFVLPLRAQTQATIVQNIVLEDETSTKTVAITGDGSIGLISGELVRRNADGNVVWRQTFERVPSNDPTYPPGFPQELVSVESASDGGFLVLSRYVKLPISNNIVYIVYKFDESGRKLWSKELLDVGPPSYSTPTGLIATADGGCLMPVNYTYPKIVGGASIIKFSRTGEIEWNTDFGSPLNNKFNLFNIKSAVERAGGYALIGTYSPDFLSNRANLIPGEIQIRYILKLVDATGKIIGEKAFPDETSLTELSYDLSTNSLLTVSATDPSNLALLKMDVSGNVLFRTRLPGIVQDAMLHIAVSPNAQDEYVLAGTNPNNGSDFYMTQINRNGVVGVSRTFGGSQRDVLNAIDFLPNGKLVLLGLTESTDGDLSQRRPLSAGPKPWVLTVNLATIPATSPFFIAPPIYDCTTGLLTVNLISGNSAPIEYSIAGNRGRSTDNVFVIPAHQRQGTTFTVVARQNNIITSIQFTTSCTTPPVTPPVTPPSGFALTTPSYDCNTGQLTINTSGSNGAAVEYRIVGNRDWSASNVFTIPAHQRQGTTFTLDARIVGGNAISIPFTSACGTTPPVTPPVTPPTGTALSFGGSSLICDTGQLTINALGGDGTPIEFKVPGLADWQRSNTFQIPTYQRNGTTFTLYIRQSGREVQTTYTPGCAVARVAVSAELSTGLNAVVLPNPVVGNELVVEITGAAGQAVDFTLTDVGGRVLTIQRAAVATDRHRQTLPVGQLNQGIYLLRVSTTSQTKTVKVMKQ